MTKDDRGGYSEGGSGIRYGPSAWVETVAESCKLVPEVPWNGRVNRVRDGRWEMGVERACL